MLTSEQLDELRKFAREYQTADNRIDKMDTKHELVVRLLYWLDPLLDSAENGLKWSHVNQHDPVGLEEITSMIQFNPIKKKSMMRVVRLLETPEKLFIFGSDPNYHVVAKADQTIKVGDIIEYEPYGAANWGTFLAVREQDEFQT